MKRTAVFDLDGTLETPYLEKKDVAAVRKSVSERYGAKTFKRMFANVLGDMPHFFLNGALELLQWVESHGFEIVFFSNAVRPRNEELCPILMKRAFAGRQTPAYRLFSRPDCLDNRHGDPAGFGRDEVDGLWHGNFKKKLSGVVVDESEIGETLMIEDDSSYACRGEERNFIHGLYGGSANEFLQFEAGDKSNGGRDKVVQFHLPFWFCGMLSRTLKIAETEHVPLCDAASRAMYGDVWKNLPAYGSYKPPKDGEWDDKTWKIREKLNPPQRDFAIFKEGLLELREFNPALRFWGGIDETASDWPKSSC